MKRRNLLKTFTLGSTCASPMVSLLARSAMAAESDSNIKTIFLFHPNGAVPGHFFPRAGTMALPPMTAPLEETKQHLLFLDGIGYAGSAATHEGGTRKCLTGSGSPRGNPISSIEVQMGKEDWQNRAETGIRVPSVQMGVGTQWGDSADKRISYDNGRDLHSVDDPRIVYAQLFGASNGSNSADIQQSIFATIQNDLTRLKNNLGTVEAERLEMHMDSMAVLEAKLNPQIEQSCGGTIDTSAIGNGNQSSLWQSRILGTVSDVQQDIAIQALACNVTRTIAFSYGVSVSPIIVPGTTDNDHNLSHQNAQAHTTSKIWWMAEVNKFIKKLENTPDRNGSLLDNTIICAVSDLGHGNFHNHYRIPMFLAGGRNTGLVTNRSLDFRPYGTAKIQGDQNANDKSINHTDILTTIAERAGYQSVSLPNTEGRINNAWTGQVFP